jgi:hypothetical protein
MQCAFAWFRLHLDLVPQLNEKFFAGLDRCKGICNGSSISLSTACKTGSYPTWICTDRVTVCPKKGVQHRPCISSACQLQGRVSYFSVDFRSNIAASLWPVRMLVSLRISEEFVTECLKKLGKQTRWVDGVETVSLQGRLLWCISDSRIYGSWAI